eukprot:4777648-Amphidinium_carterae.1
MNVHPVAGGYGLEVDSITSISTVDLLIKALRGVFGGADLGAAGVVNTWNASRAEASICNVIATIGTSSFYTNLRWQWSMVWHHVIENALVTRSTGGAPASAFT